jgi:thioredoxin 1
MANANVKHLTDDNFDAEVIKNSKPVLVDFWASWCGPCMMQAPILDEFAGIAGDKIIVGKLSTEENSATPVKYGIQAIPTLILFKNGQPAERMVGVQNINKLKELLERNK